MKKHFKYSTKTEFNVNSISAYNSARKNGWLDEICSHMGEIRKPKGYWDIKENCKEEASKYDTRNEFQKKSQGVYTHIRKKGWLDELCSHMVRPLSGIYFIYGYFFSDNHCYIGLSKNIKKRKSSHLKNEKSPVYTHQLETGLKPEFKILHKQEIFNDIEIKEKEEYYFK